MTKPSSVRADQIGVGSIVGGGSSVTLVLGNIEYSSGTNGMRMFTMLCPDGSVMSWRVYSDVEHVLFLHYEPIEP